MTTTAEAVKKLELLLQKATNPNLDDIDITALDGFCTTIQSDPSLSIHATKLLANRIQSTNTAEAMHALCILEESMKSCGPEFQSEIGKFRFLNDLCMLVSTKYKGNVTPKKIKDKILDLLLVWTVQYSHLTKVKEIYDMLRTQGVVHEPVKNIAIDHRRHVPNITASRPAEDETSQRLRKLVQSKDPTDVKAANLLIQNMVRENERRDQMKSSRLLELQRVRETVSVLNDMLDQYDSVRTTESELSTMKELHSVCENLQPTIIRLAQETQENEESLGDILDASNHLNDVFERYKQIIIEHKYVMPKSKSNHSPNNVLPSTNSTSSSSAALLDILSGPVSSDQNIESKTAGYSNEVINSITSELTDIFSSPEGILKPEQIKSASDKYEDNIYSILNIFSASNGNSVTSSPIKPMASSSSELKPSPKKTFGSSTQHSRGIPDLDSLVTDMLNSTLNKQQKSENALEEDASEVVLVVDDKCDNLLDNDDKILNCDIELTNPIELKSFAADDAVATNSPIINNSAQQKSTKIELKSLADLEIDIDQITPSTVDPRTVMNDPNGLRVVLNFAADHPRPDVSVIVVTVINQGTKPISSFQFNASISKGCRLRLLPASSNSLPGCKPFRPPSDDITQVLLYSNQNNLDNVNLVCILSYCIGTDPDPINESIEIKNLSNS